LNYHTGAEKADLIAPQTRKINDDEQCMNWPKYLAQPFVVWQKLGEKVRFGRGMAKMG